MPLSLSILHGFLFEFFLSHNKYTNKAFSSKDIPKEETFVWALLCYLKQALKERNSNAQNRDAEKLFSMRLFKSPNDSASIPLQMLMAELPCWGKLIFQADSAKFYHIE